MTPLLPHLHRIARVLPLCLVVFLGFGCDRDTVTASSPTAPRNPAAGSVKLPVLFVGNSLTRVNDLPGMVAALSAAAGDSVQIVTGSVAIDGASLADHLADGRAEAAIATAMWKVVVLQQGPSALPESRDQLIASTRTFAAQIAAVGGHTALYQVWPEAARIGVLDDVLTSYALAAEDVGGLLLPAGAAWKEAWAMDPEFPLYGPDAFHPSVLGTYVAALAIRAVLNGKDPIGSPAQFTVGATAVAIPAKQAELAQAAAEAATHDLRSVARATRRR